MNKEMLDRFELALIRDHLRELVKKFVVEGRSQVEIYYLFAQYQDFLRESGRRDDASRVLGTISDIIGWCGENSLLFEHYLTDEEIDAYQQSLIDSGKDH